MSRDENPLTKPLKYRNKAAKPWMNTYHLTFMDVMIGLPVLMVYILLLTFMVMGTHD